ncbi:MAG: ATP synthase F0 subunit B [Bdellovibrionota bacterium]
MKSHSTLYIFVFAAIFTAVALLLPVVGFWKAIGLEAPHGYLYQGLLFLGLLWILQVFVFEPYIRTAEERDAQTEGKRKWAQKNQLLSQEKWDMYQQRISDAKLRAAKQREEIIMQAEDEEKKSLDQAREKAAGQLAKEKQQLESDVAQVQSTLDQYIDPIQTLLVERVLGHAQPGASARKNLSSNSNVTRAK